MKPTQLKAIETFTMRSARTIRARGEEVQPIILLFHYDQWGELGKVRAMPCPGDKDTWAILHQHYAKVRTVAASVLITEAWQSIAIPGQPIPLRPSLDPQRQEVLTVNVLTDTEQYFLTAEIHGKNIDDAVLIQVKPGNMTGRFIRETAAA